MVILDLRPREAEEQKPAQPAELCTRVARGEARGERWRRLASRGAFGETRGGGAEGGGVRG